MTALALSQTTGPREGLLARLARFVSLFCEAYAEALATQRRLTARFPE